MGIPLDKAELLALFLECILYGIFLTFFILIFVISFGEKDARIVNQRFILPVAILMMILAIVHLTVDFNRLLQGFVTGDMDKPANPIKYYENLSHPLHITKTVAYTIQTTLGDAVLVWRCYVIYNKSLYVIIPAGLILCANLAIGGVVTWSLQTAAKEKSIFQTAHQFIEGFFIITMILNFCCTAAIVGKIWVIRRRATTASRSLFPVIAAIIESGALYTTSVLGLLIAYLLGSFGAYPALDVVTPLVGVTYCLIVLQIHFHLKTSNSAGRATSNWSIPQAWRRNVLATDTTMHGYDYKTYALQGEVAVHVSEHAETHTDELRPPKIHFDVA